MKNIAIILSGGYGSRFGSNIPKQFINLAGKNIIEYTIIAFEQNPSIDEICIVADIFYHDKIWQLVKNNNFQKVKKIINSGVERKDSSFNAIKAYEKYPENNLIFHDAVRPFISQNIINKTIKALDKYNAVDVAIETADTIVKINDKKLIESIPERAFLRRGQTPQAFKLKTIKKAHILSQKDKNEQFFTDDCGLVKYYLNEKVYVVNGSEKNIKITYPEDLLFAEKLLQNTSTYLESSSYEKIRGKTYVVFGGSSGIGFEIINLCTSLGANAKSFSRSNGYDINNILDIKNAMQTTYEEYGKIDGIIVCSAILIKNRLINASQEEISNQINTNYLASVLIAKESYIYLKKTKGHLILFTSSSYTRGRIEYSVYSSSKAAIVNFMQALSEEWNDEGIKINVINPARTKTPMREKNFGREPSSALLDPKKVAQKTLDTLLSNFSGLVIDIKKDIL